VIRVQVGHIRPVKINMRPPPPPPALRVSVACIEASRERTGWYPCFGGGGIELAFRRSVNFLSPSSPTREAFLVPGQEHRRVVKVSDW